MKIAVIRQRYNPYGGAERFVARAAAALSAQGASVTVIARDWTGAQGEGRWLRCNPFHLGRLWRDAGFARAACRAAAAGFDLVQSHERIACCDIYRAGDGVHAQWLAYRAEALSPLERMGLRWHPYHRYVLRAERRLFASTRLAAVICNSAMVRNEIAGRFGIDPAKLHVIHNGVDLASFSPRLRGEHREAVRRRLGLADGDRVALFVGSGFERKGLPQLIEALRRRADPSLHLVVVGRDRDQRRLAARARRLGLERQVHWTGGQQDVRPYYGAADCLVLPTLYDPFPNAALEALACGLPVVTTRRCGAAELIVEGRSGYVLSDPFDIEALASRLGEAVASGAQARDAARAAAEPLGIAAMADKLIALYKTLIDKENRALP